MRVFGAVLLASSLLMTSAFAATLPAGKPAGVKKAQTQNNNALLIAIGIGLAGMGIGLAASSGNSNNAVTPTTASVSTVAP